MPDRLLICSGELSLLGAFTTEANSLAMLDLEAGEHVLEAGEERLFLLLGPDDGAPATLTEVPLRLILNHAAHADVVDLTVSLVDVGDGLSNPRVTSCISLNVRPDTLSVEGMLARIDKEFPIVKDRSEADVAVLSRVDHNMPVLLVTPL